jgi:methanogenic corrinoid protein MtbC1
MLGGRKPSGPALAEASLMHDFLSEEQESGWSGEAAEVGRLALKALNVLAARGHEPWAMQEPLFQQFVDTAATGDPAAFAETVAQLRKARVSPRAIVESYVPEAARRLGDDWLEDRKGFVEVTIACSALQSLVRMLTEEYDVTQPSAEVAAILLAVPEDENHTLGAIVAASWLRRNGASVCLQLQVSRAELCKNAASGGFDAIMLSWANVERLECLAGIVKQVRLVLPRPAPIVVGGPVIGRTEGIERSTGADLATNDLEDVMARFAAKRLSSYSPGPSQGA